MKNIITSFALLIGLFSNGNHVNEVPPKQLIRNKLVRSGINLKYSDRLQRPDRFYNRKFLA
jgi:hypothetical protein